MHHSLPEQKRIPWVNPLWTKSVSPFSDRLPHLYVLSCHLSCQLVCSCTWLNLVKSRTSSRLLLLSSLIFLVARCFFALSVGPVYACQPTRLYLINCKLVKKISPTCPVRRQNFRSGNHEPHI